MPEQLTLDQLQREKVFLCLTPRQQRLVIAYLTNGHDKIAAIKSAFDCKSSSVRIMSYNYFNKRQIVAVLAVAAGGDPEREQFDLDLHRAIQNPRTTRNQISALRLMAQTRGYIVSAEPAADAVDETETPSTHTFKIGDRVTQRDDAGIEHVGIVRRIDDEGRAIEIAEVL